MARYVTARKFPGNSILLARNGHVLHHHATGLRDIAANLPFDRDTVVRLYSMTKPITSTALMMLAERGLLHLNAPVSDFIPSFKDMVALVPGAQSVDQVEPSRSPTLQQLLTHTAGLSYGFNPGLLPRAMADSDTQFAPDRGTVREMADHIAGFPLAFQPGTCWEYSVAIDIIGRVIEIVSNQTLASFFEREIFQPLGMQDTGFRVPDRNIGRFAALYTPLAGDPKKLNSTARGADTLRLVDQPETSAYRSTSLFSGGGGLVGTLDDYMRFVEMLRCGGALGGVRLLSPKTIEFMMRNHLPGDIASMGPDSFAEQPVNGIGFGIGDSVVLDPARAGIPGSVGDFSWGGMASTYFWIDRRHDLSVVFFTQLSPSSAYPARAELKSLIHGAMLE